MRTPAVLDRPTPNTVSFQRIVSAAKPSLTQMMLALGPLHGMRRDGLNRFDPFRRILPRLALAPDPVRLLAAALKAQDAALSWSPAAVIHGDLHPGQMLVDGRKKVWLVDLDDLALAPPEADLGNLAAWMATHAEGPLEGRTHEALSRLEAVSPLSDPALTDHFCRIALVRRALKLAEKGQIWALDQLALRA
ncbi:phosphotransferase family protein [Loktanella sp. DJP18]|uniref:phosphotransferase family protein n=1 Tax=Loktanella sp. DJP18 TaxID=3409788 RepID=UPI003BB58D85